MGPRWDLDWELAGSSSGPPTLLPTSSAARAATYVAA
jgi:hypothetical protein